MFIVMTICIFFMNYVKQRYLRSENFFSYFTARRRRDKRSSLVAQKLQWKLICQKYVHERKVEPLVTRLYWQSIYIIFAEVTIGGQLHLKF